MARLRVLRQIGRPRTTPEAVLRGVTDTWWRGEDSLIAVYRGEAVGFGVAPRCLEAHVYSALTSGPSTAADSRQGAGAGSELPPGQTDRATALGHA